MFVKWSTGDADQAMSEDILVELAGQVSRHPWFRARAKLAVAVLRMMNILPPARVLDAGCGWGLTLEVLEAKGVRFIPALEGNHEAGVALRWGAELSQRSSWNDETPKSDKGLGRNAAPTWDDFAEAEPVPPEIEDLRTFWRTRPAEWAALHEASRHALLREMRIGEF